MRIGRYDARQALQALRSGALTIALVLSLLVPGLGTSITYAVDAPDSTNGSNAAGRSNTADGQEWTIDTFVAAAIRNSGSYQKAQESLETTKLNEKLSIPLLESSLSASGSWSTDTGPQSPGTGGKKTLSIKLPVTEKLTLSGDYTIGNDSGKISLSYSPLAGVSSVKDLVEDLPGSIIGSVGASDAARSATKMSELKLADAESAARLNARKTYINAIKTVKALQTAQEEYRLANVSLEIAQKRYDSGLAGEDEVETAETSLLDAEISLMMAQNDDKRMRKNLSEMTGVDMSEAVFADLPEFQLELPDLYSLIASAVKNDPDLRQAEADLSAAEKSLESAKDLLPDLRAEASVKTDDWSATYSVTASWSISPSRSADIEKSKISLDQKRRAVDDVRKLLEDTISQDYEDLQIELKAMDKWKAQLDAAEKTYNQALEDFNDGNLLQVDMDRARLNYRNAQDSYLSHWSNVWTLWYGLVDLCWYE